MKSKPAILVRFCQKLFKRDDGDFNMFNEQMPPFRKYPAALRAYRQVLTYDKTNKKAATNIKTIEDIYKSMGRPVPQ